MNAVAKYRKWDNGIKLFVFLPAAHLVAIVFFVPTYSTDAFLVFMDKYDLLLLILSGALLYLPQSARHGFEWWQIDVTWYLIWLMEKLGLAWKDLLGSNSVAI